MYSTLQIFICALIVWSSVGYSWQRSSLESAGYVAAVVEYSPTVSGDGEETFQKNVDNYIRLIEVAAGNPNNADIIVFPEGGLVSLVRRLYSQIPEPSDKIVPCDEDSGLFVNLERISCAAKTNQVYVVINLSEVFPCENGTLSLYNQTCPQSGAFHYNSNVAFDRDGSVIARYRKFNLFGEYGMDIPPVAELVTFQTDFGVTFGLFTCFDINFEKPAVQLVREQNITDIIFPTAWFSELPFLTAVQAQAAWSHSMDVNFLGAGYSAPESGSAGSGIFAGRDGPLATIMPTTASTHLLVRTVPKKTSRSKLNWNEETTSKKWTPQKFVDSNRGLLMMRDNLTLYESQLLDPLSMDAKDVRLCYEEFCCNFTISAKRSDSGSERFGYFYHMAVFDGNRTFSGYVTSRVQLCAVISCTNETLSSCTEEFDDTTNLVPTIFSTLNIQGDFKSKSTIQLPNTLTEGYHALPARDFSMTWVQKSGDPTIVSCTIALENESSFRTFGIYGFDFAPETTGGGTRGDLHYTSCLLLLVATLLALYR